MINVRDHRDLRVWKIAVEIGVRCYDLSRTFPREERYGLTAQLRSAAVSVAANIAEGNGRLTRGEYLNHPSIARGSLRDVDTHLEFAYRLGYATNDAIQELRDLLDVAAALLTRLIQFLQKTGNRRQSVPGSQFPLIAGGAGDGYAGDGSGPPMIGGTRLGSASDGMSVAGAVGGGIVGVRGGSCSPRRSTSISSRVNVSRSNSAAATLWSSSRCSVRTAFARLNA